MLIGERLVLPLATPFREDGSLDAAAFAENLERYREAGVTGFLVAGTTGEGPHLEAAEILQLVGMVARGRRGGELVMAGLPAGPPASGRSLLQRVREAGAEGVLVGTPAYYGRHAGSAGLAAYFRALAEDAGIPLYLYNIPQLTHVVLPVEVVAELAEHRWIGGMKESSGNLAYLQEVLGRTRDSDFEVVSGAGAVFALSRPLGIRGGILAVGCVVPELVLEVMRTPLDSPAFAEVQSRLARLAAIGGDYGVPGIKWAMELRGWRGGCCRLPLQSLDEAARNRIASLLQECGF
ncbi:MAG: dihydrodipicolinate synthase family protein [Acidobacteriota bacterium]